MKTKITLALSLVLLLSLILSTGVLAKDSENANNRAKSNDVELRIEDNNKDKNKSDQATSTEVEDDDQATSTEDNDKDGEDKDNKGQLTAETHRSAVATFVKSLLAVADREGGIGEQVREVARVQNNSATTTALAMVRIEERNSIRTFFLGSDYKNLGIIRSGLATTSNNIAQLKSLLDQTTDDTVRVELQTQIQALEAEQIKLTTYVTAHENIFSLFGWFTKLFVK